MKKICFQGGSLIVGENSLAELEKLDFKRAVIVTGGSSMKKTGALNKLLSILNKGEALVIDGVPSNPTDKVVNEGAEIMRDFKPDLIVSIGGGSAIDAAKAMMLFYEFDHLSFDNVFSSPLPQKRVKTTFVAIPSTSGTASEITHVTVITMTDTGKKLAIRTEALRPDIAVLDGALCVSMPQSIAAQTGMDALTHAIESFTNKAGNDMTDAIAKGAIEGILTWLEPSVKTASLESRQHMHNFSAMAGMSFSNAGLGMVHGISHAFSGLFDTPHGLANAIILPYVLRYNKRDKWVSDKLNKLSRMAGEDIITRIEALSKALCIPRNLMETGISEEAFTAEKERLYDYAMLGSTVVNPVSMTKEHIAKMVDIVYYGGEMTF